MAEATDLERTEPASQRRLDQARERGQIARSPELATFAVLMASGAGLLFMGGLLARSLADVMRAGLTVDRSAAFDPARMGVRLYEAATAALVGFSPFFLLVAAVAIFTPMLVSGWLFTVQGLGPDFSRLNPMAGFSRILSWRGVIELSKGVLKALLVGGVAVLVVWSERGQIIGLGNEPLEPALLHLGHLLGYTFLLVAGSLALIVLVDVPFQIWDHHRQLRMTKEELRQEMKETEGDPQIKARIRALQREAARRRMMAQVPKADVVVTNPIRFAVALRYTEGSMRAPRVVAKGSLLLAQRIVELAHGAGVPVLRSPPLARALFAHAEIDRDIPAALYTAVAEVLAWVYQVRRFETSGGEPPREPSAVAVPAELDPGEAAAPVSEAA